MGEDLLRFLAAERLLPGAGKGVYAAYERHVQVDAARGYAFAVEVMAGLDERRLEELSRDFFDRRFAGRIFPWVRPLLARLRREEVEIWLCSASPRWVVEAGARCLGIPAEQVIGVSCEVKAGKLTGRVQEPVSAGPGKVAWLERRGVVATLAAGNGALDLDMLAAAVHALVVAPYDAPDSALAREGSRRGWPVLTC